MIIAPTAHFSASLDRTGTAIRGYAAPEQGPAPCRLLVRNGHHVVSAAEATGYAGDDCPIRLGWCGFSVTLTPALFIFADDLELVCAHSGAVLMTLISRNAEQPGEIMPKRPAPRAVISARDLLADPVSSPPASGIARLLDSVAQRNTPELATHVLYQLLLSREADPAGFHGTVPLMRDLPSILSAVEAAVNSPEHQALPASRHFRSPYQDRVAFEVLLAIANSAGPDAGTAPSPQVIIVEDAIQPQGRPVPKAHVGEVDPAWYRRHYRDVDLLGIDPLTHYEWIGRRMGRAPNAASLSAQAG